MTAYRDLGPTLNLTATLDQTNNNPGNWTIVADGQSLNFKVAQAEVYQISIDGPIGSSFSVYRNRRLWNKVAQGWSNSYDPQQPLILRPTDTVFFYWNTGPPNTPVPTAILWIRFDTDLQENKYDMGGG